MAAAAAVARFDPVEDTDAGGIEMTSAGRQRLVEVEEVDCTVGGSKLAGVKWEHKRVRHRQVGDMRRTLQLISRERSQSVGRD